MTDALEHNLSLPSATTIDVEEAPLSAEIAPVHADTNATEAFQERQVVLQGAIDTLDNEADIDAAAMAAADEADRAKKPRTSKTKPF